MATAVSGAQHLVPLGADELLELAEASTGDSFRDLGDGDWETRFRALVAAVDENPLHVVGRLMSREELLRNLRTRIHLGRLLADHPEVANEQIRQPVVVVGPARSGTSITFELLGLDRSLRAPVAADALHPASPLSASDRASATECEQELWADVHPGFDAIHELRSDLPVECVLVSAPSFAGYHWISLLPATNGDWRMDVNADMAVHRLVLQALQYGGEPRTWLLKTPVYLVEFERLTSTYPDALVVQTHRDPAKTMPSTVSTQMAMGWVRSDEVDVELSAAVVGPFFGGAIRRLARARHDGSLPMTFADLRYLELMADPVGAIRATYEQLGRAFTDEHAAAIIEYLTTKPKGKHGEHGYTAEEWGFDPVATRAHFTDYLNDYEIETEE